MAQLKFSQLNALTGHDDANLLALSYWDGAAFTESQQLTWGDLKTELNDTLNTLYNANGTLTSARTVTQDGNLLTFTGGNVAIGGASGSEMLHVNGSVRIDANISNQLFVSDSASFVGVKSTAPLLTEAFRVVGEIVSKGYATDTASSVVPNRYKTGALGMLQLDNVFVKDKSGTMEFESSSNTFKFRNNLNNYSLFELTQGGSLMESKLSSATTTLQSHNTRITSNYWTGSNNVNIVDIKNTAINTSGDYKLGFEVGGSERMNIDDTGQVNMSNLPTSNPGGSGNLWNNSGVLNIT